MRKRSSATRPCRRLIAGLLLQGAAGACSEPDTVIGSVCQNGICEQTTGLDAPVCSLSPKAWWIGTNESGQEHCFPFAPDDIDGSGRIDCVLTFGFLGHEGAAAEGCTEPPWIPLDAATREYYERSGVPGPKCLLSQLSSTERAEPGQRGWYYEEDAERACARRLHISADLAPGCRDQLDCGTELQLICPGVDAPGADGTAADSDVSECRLPAKIRSNDAVGRACMPTAVPASGFDDRSATIETSDRCGGGPCLVFRLTGDPRPDCEPEAPGPLSSGRVCSDPEHVDKRVYCSCRCRGPEGEGPFCECPAGYVCVDMIEQGPSEVRGGYCVRDIL